MQRWERQGLRWGLGRPESIHGCAWSAAPRHSRQRCEVKVSTAVRAALLLGRRQWLRVTERHLCVKLVELIMGVSTLNERSGGGEPFALLRGVCHLFLLVPLRTNLELFLWDRRPVRVTLWSECSGLFSSTD